MEDVLADSAPLPTGLPPWMVAAMVAGWLAVVVLAVALFVYFRAVRADRRAEGRKREGSKRALRP